MRFSTTAAGLLSLLSGCAAAAPPAAGPHTLISVKENVRVESWRIGGTADTPAGPVAWSVTKRTLHGGKQEGVDLVVVDNGCLRIAVVPTRGMGILDVTRGGVRLGWDSPVPEVVHPQFIRLDSRGGRGWLEGFNEWLCRCGLEWSGGPGQDRYPDEAGNEVVRDLSIHGLIANTPASEVSVAVDPEPPRRIRVRGRVAERMVHGAKLDLDVEISTEPGAASFRVADVVTNRGGYPQEFMMLYHTNVGRPILDAGAAFVGPVERVTPLGAYDPKEIAAWATYAPPTHGFRGQVYCLRLHGGPDGRTLAMLRNKAGDRAVSMAYDLQALPCLAIWKCTRPEAEGYVTGIEPGTCYPSLRLIERKAGRVPKLAPGASHAMALDVSLLVGADEVRRAADRIAEIQRGRTTTVDERPATGH
jgi:hypothetical protein